VYIYVYIHSALSLILVSVYWGLIDCEITAWMCSWNSFILR